MKSNIRIAALIAAVSVAFLATQTAHAEWKGGFVQGNNEYISEKDDLRVIVWCPAVDDKSTSYSKVSLQRLSTMKKIGVFTMTVNGHTYNGPIDSSDRVGSDNFRSFMADIRKGDLVLKYALGTVVYPKSNAPKIIPVAIHNIPCNTML